MVLSLSVGPKSSSRSAGSAGCRECSGAAQAPTAKVWLPGVAGSSPVAAGAAPNLDSVGGERLGGGRKSEGVAGFSPVAAGAAPNLGSVGDERLGGGRKPEGDDNQ